jgi:hypothetical protein
MSHRLLFLFIVITLLLDTSVFVSVQILSVKALVPNIVSVESYDVGSVTWVNITIHHTPPPAIGPSHYVSNVQVEVNGVVEDLSQSPQSTETFSVQYSLGPNTDTYSVRARAYCIVHGYSAWSNIETVPEISWLAAVLLIVFATISITMANPFLRRHTKTLSYCSSCSLAS